MAVSLKHLEAFVAVADQLSFRRAAERLNTTQPNISARIAALEARLGVVLMERDAGSVRLTPKGDTLLTHARRVIGEVDGMIAAAADNSLYEGVIRLGVTEMMGAAQKEAAGSFLYFEAFLVVAVIYWVMVEALNQGQKALETRLNKAYAR